MAIFLEYHDVEALDYLPLQCRPLRPVELPRTVAPPIGGTVLLIAGTGRPKRYHVWERYRIRSAEKHEEETYLLPADRVFYQPPIRLTDPLLAAVLRSRAGREFWMIEDGQDAELMGLLQYGDLEQKKLEIYQEDEPADDGGAEERFWSEVIADRPRDGDPYGIRAKLRQRRGATELEVEDLRNFRDLPSYVPRGARKLGGELIVVGRPEKRKTGANGIGSLWEARQKILKTAGRPGQGEFRKQVLAMFAGTCIVTGCTIERVVQAAHLVPYSSSRLQKVHNGIALRADIHMLFDLHLLRIDSRSNRVNLQPDLQGTEYWQYENNQLTFPAKLLAMQEFREALTQRWQIANTVTEGEGKEDE
jgi:hypothetical protein